MTLSEVEVEREVEIEVEVAIEPEWAPEEVVDDCCEPDEPPRSRPLLPASDIEN
uniref:Uncharacterized protein n=1 Tax=Arion vulgaris TaxID=1028688 RepID=A0A0B6YHN6_9EUPU